MTQHLASGGGWLLRAARRSYQVLGTQRVTLMLQIVIVVLLVCLTVAIDSLR